MRSIRMIASLSAAVLGLLVTASCSQAKQCEGTPTATASPEVVATASEHVTVTIGPVPQQRLSKVAPVYMGPNQRKPIGPGNELPKGATVAVLWQNGNGRELVHVISSDPKSGYEGDRVWISSAETEPAGSTTVQRDAQTMTITQPIDFEDGDTNRALAPGAQVAVLDFVDADWFVYVISNPAQRNGAEQGHVGHLRVQGRTKTSETDWWESIPTTKPASASC